MGTLFLLTVLVLLQTQAALILSQRSAAHSTKVIADLPALMEELVGFFIIESHVLRATRDFRSQREVDDLWNEMSRRIVQIVGDALKGCEESEVFLTAKGHILIFIQTLEVSTCMSLIGRLAFIDLHQNRTTDTTSNLSRPCS